MAAVAIVDWIVGEHTEEHYFNFHVQYRIVLV
jgi:hypothetical protein